MPNCVYMHLQGLIELKIAAGRMKDHADVVAFPRTRPRFPRSVNTCSASILSTVRFSNRLAEQAEREDIGIN